MSLERRQIHPDGPAVFVEGNVQYFHDSHRPKIRWALIHWPDDGIPVAGHGAGDTLEEARHNARRCLQRREELKRCQ